MFLSRHEDSWFKSLSLGEGEWGLLGPEKCFQELRVRTHAWAVRNGNPYNQITILTLTLLCAVGVWLHTQRHQHTHTRTGPTANKVTRGANGHIVHKRHWSRNSIAWGPCTEVAGRMSITKLLVCSPSLFQHCAKEMDENSDGSVSFQEFEKLREYLRSTGGFMKAWRHWMENTKRREREREIYIYVYIYIYIYTERKTKREKTKKRERERERLRGLLQSFAVPCQTNDFRTFIVAGLRAKALSTRIPIQVLSRLT